MLQHAQMLASQHRVETLDLKVETGSLGQLGQPVELIWTTQAVASAGVFLLLSRRRSLKKSRPFWPVISGNSSAAPPELQEPYAGPELEASDDEANIEEDADDADANAKEPPGDLRSLGLGSPCSFQHFAEVAGRSQQGLAPSPKIVS